MNNSLATKEIKDHIIRLMTDFNNPEVIFYAHILARFRIIFVEMKYTASVNFTNGGWNLYICKEKFFKEKTLQQQAILIHEILHVIYFHLERKQFRNHKMWNYAADIAINQSIKNIPEWTLSYQQFNLPENLNSEQYYELLSEKACKICNKCPKKDTCEEKIKCPNSSSSNNQNGNNQNGNDQNSNNQNGNDFDFNEKDFYDENGEFKCPFEDDLDNHDFWKTSDVDQKTLKKMTKDMVNDAIKKSRGNLPSDIEYILELLNEPAQVNWKKELRNIVANKKYHYRYTLKKRSRRFPTREDIKGKVTNRTFDLLVIGDVSGSMSNQDLNIGLNEIKEICKITKSDLKIIQVDVEPKIVDNFKVNDTSFVRKGVGGTYLYPAVEYANKEKITYDALVIITDGEIESLVEWENIKKPIFWLITNYNQNFEEEAKKYINMRIFQLDD